MGWQGLTMLAPPAWNLVSYGGDAKAGSLRLDNSEFQAHGVLGVDVRWIPVKGKVTDADLEKRLALYLASIEKSAKRQKIATVTQTKAVRDTRATRSGPARGRSPGRPTGRRPGASGTAPSACASSSPRSSAARGTTSAP